MSTIDRQLLQDMALAAQHAVEMATTTSRELLEKNYRDQYALTYAIQVVGEAASRVSPTIQANFPTIEWEPIIGMRNRLVHGYSDVNLDILWAVIMEDLPHLIRILNTILSS
jgi:uncharacterized protein with HEPN domain